MEHFALLVLERKQLKYLRTINLPPVLLATNRAVLHEKIKLDKGYRTMVFNATFNNISAISLQSVLLVEETGVPRENHRPVASYCQT